MVKKQKRKNMYTNNKNQIQNRKKKKRLSKRQISILKQAKNFRLTTDTQPHAACHVPPHAACHMPCGTLKTNGIPAFHMSI